MNDYLNPNVNLYNGHFYKALRKYGVENFTFQIIELCRQDELNEREIYWIKYYDSFNNGYNQTIGGENVIKIDREEFINYYINECPTVMDIMEHFKICRETVTRIVNELELQPNWRISENEKEDICNKYLNEKDSSITSLAKEFNRDPETISRILHNNNISIRNSKTHKHDYYVYDCNTNELLFVLYQSTMGKLCEELVNKDVINGNIPKSSTIWNHINRNSKKLYNCIRIRTSEEN